jgi:poly(hydroxyalkanoate) depolymerase family esterase
LPGLAVGVGGARRYRVYRPPGLAFNDPAALVVMLHGCGQDATSFALCTRMNRIADRARFIVLYPEQDRMANAQGCWNWYDTDTGRAWAEAGLILQAIDQVCLRFPVDRARIAVVGLSAGASMAALLATRHPERFRALVMHSGIPPGSAHSALSAVGAMHGRQPGLRPAMPLAGTTPWPPLLVIHGGADGVVAPRNGDAAVQAWSDAAGAAAGPPRSVQRGQRHPMIVTDYRCGSHMAAQLVQVPRLGHAWSGGAAGQPFSDSLGPDASRLAWAFIARQWRGARRRGALVHAPSASNR